MREVPRETGLPAGLRTLRPNLLDRAISYFDPVKGLAGVRGWSGRNPDANEIPNRGCMNWRKVPEWVQWLAVDSDGDLVGYEEKPNLHSDCWASSKGHWEVLGKRSARQWRQSLSRPGAR